MAPPVIDGGVRPVGDDERGLIAGLVRVAGAVDVAGTVRAAELLDQAVELRARPLPGREVRVGRVLRAEIGHRHLHHRGGEPC